MRAVRELGGFAAVIALILMFVIGKVVLYDTLFTMQERRCAFRRRRWQRQNRIK